MHCKTVGDIFAPDVVYHKSCMTNFISEFQKNVNKLFDGNDEYCEINMVIETLTEVAIAIEHSKKVIQYLTVEMYEQLFQ